MPQFYRIYPLPLCNLTLDKGFFTYLALKYYGKKGSIPVYAWLIDGGEEPILVDVGASAKELLKWSAFAKKIKDIVTVEESLARLGISMSDIKIIIITHLDTDHILNANKFPNARFIVQEEELRSARNPHPLVAHRRHQELYEGLDFQTITGDTEIIPGVEAIFTPGHTEGSQSVAVGTEQGKVVICGLCTIDENFSDEGDIIPGVHSNPYEAYDSMVKIKKMADIVIPLHSQRLVSTKTIP